MSISYEASGRTQQKARTRGALVEAARELLDHGRTPTVEEAAAAAAISRATAYRYFPNQRVLLAATYPEIEMASLLGRAPPADVEARLDLVTERYTQQLLEHEGALRAQLRLSLEPTPPAKDQMPFRKGRAIEWIEEALAPLREEMESDAVRRLAIAIRAAIGVEALVWLTDVAGVSRKEAVDIVRSSARAILRAAREGRGRTVRARVVR